MRISAVYLICHIPKYSALYQTMINTAFEEIDIEENNLLESCEASDMSKKEQNWALILSGRINDSRTLLNIADRIH